MEFDSNDLKLISNKINIVDNISYENRFADTILTNANFVNVLTREIYISDVAIKGKHILKVGDCKNLIGNETEILDVKGKFVAPGLIDSFMHFESSMLTLTEFTKLSLSSGTTCLIPDLNEIDNVLGPEGIAAVMDEASKMPQHVVFSLPNSTTNPSGLKTCGANISFHEGTSKDEAVEKLRSGVYMLMREGSTQSNMPDCIKAITEEKLDSRRLILATDDILPRDISLNGHMNEVIRRTINQGVDPVEAIQMATINPATWLGLTQVGALAPGKVADIIVINGEIKDMRVDMVFLSGKLVARDNKLLIDLPDYKYPDSVKEVVKRDFINTSDLMLKTEGNKAKIRCIGLIANTNLTGSIEASLDIRDGYVLPDLNNDIIPISVVGMSGHNSIGKSFVKGFKLKKGAMAESISHGTHNIIVTGTNYEDMAIAVNRVIEMQGGVVVVKNNQVIGELSLPIGGLMDDQVLSCDIINKMDHLHNIVKEELKCMINAPFTHLGFMSLITSPKLKITDKGLVDTDNNYILDTLIKSREGKKFPRGESFHSQSSWI